MCTVAVLALPDGGYLLGHNRDESHGRGRAAPPTERASAERRFLAPTDADAGGTWIAVNDAGVAVCVLNAAERDPARLPAVPESRGRLALDLAGATDPREAVEAVERDRRRLAGVRAFHLVVVAPGARGAGPRAVRIRWDGATVATESHAPPCLFVSALLDQEGAERERGRSWSRFLAAPEAATPDALARWLANHDPRPGMLSACVHRADARTVSRTLARVPAEGPVEIRYLDGSPCDPHAPETRHALARAIGGSRAQPR